MKSLPKVERLPLCPECGMPDLREVDLAMPQHWPGRWELRCVDCGWRSRVLGPMDNADKAMQ
jgi:hypothetical protein